MVCSTCCVTSCCVAAQAACRDIVLEGLGWPGSAGQSGRAGGGGRGGRTPSCCSCAAAIRSYKAWSCKARICCCCCGASQRADNQTARTVLLHPVTSVVFTFLEGREERASEDHGMGDSSAPRSPAQSWASGRCSCWPDGVAASWQRASGRLALPHQHALAVSAALKTRRSSQCGSQGAEEGRGAQEQPKKSAPAMASMLIRRSSCGLRRSLSLCAKKHTRRVHRSPSAQSCEARRGVAPGCAPAGGWLEETAPGRGRPGRAHLRAVARGVQPALKHAVCVRARVPPPAAARLRTTTIPRRAASCRASTRTGAAEHAVPP